MKISTEKRGMEWDTVRGREIEKKHNKDTRQGEVGGKWPNSPRSFLWHPQLEKRGRMP